MGWFRRERKEVFCDECKHFMNPRYYLEAGGCYHPSNLSEKVTKTPIIRTVTHTPIRSYLEMNANNDCVLFKQRVYGGYLD